MVRRILLGALIVVSFSQLIWPSQETLGSETVISSSSGFTKTAGGSPFLTLIAVALLICYSLTFNHTPRVEQPKFTSMWYRAAAFGIDLWIAFVIGTGVLSIPPLLLEAWRTGAYQWYFRRTYSVSSDWVDLPLIIVALIWMVGYFVVPLVKRGQTLGCWLFRLAVVGDGYVPIALTLRKALHRTHLEVKSAMSPRQTFKDVDSRGQTPYDRVTDLTVVRY